MVGHSLKTPTVSFPGYFRGSALLCAAELGALLSSACGLHPQVLALGYAICWLVHRHVGMLYTCTYPRDSLGKCYICNITVQAA